MKSPKSPESEAYKAAYLIEKQARINAEILLEDKTRALYFANKAKSDLFYTFTQINREGYNLEKMLQIFIEAICKLCAWPVGHVFASSKTDPNELEYLDIWFLENPNKFRKFREVTKRVHLSSGVGLPGRVLAARKPLWIEDVVTDPNFPRNKVSYDLGVTSGFGVPIWCENKIIAIAEFFTTEKIVTDPNLLGLVDNAAKQLSLIIEQRKAYLEAKENYQKLQETQIALEKLAHFDPLTGLANRTQFQTMLMREIARAKRLKSKLGLLYIDLDNFKKINDSFGHDIGNLLLKKVAQRLLSTVRIEDIVARLSGDEFMVLLVDIKDVDDAGFIANKVISTLAKPYKIDGHKLLNSASIGIACYPESGSNELTLSKNADIAMYNAKISGRNNYQFFTKKIQEAHSQRLNLENGLRFALEKQQFFLVYQPEFDLRTNKMIGMEVLLRWEHPKQGIIMPDEFIPIAEEMGLMVAIGQWIITTACEQYVKWRKSLKKFNCILAINVAASQLREKNFYKFVASTLEKLKIPSKLLQLELTETIDKSYLELINSQLVQLNKMGISLTIDDYGTGYSSMTRLKEFPIQSVKIDKSFIRDLNIKMSDNLIVKSTVDLAKELGLNVIAEGVETKEQLESLVKLNCPQAQGYYYSKPLSVKKMDLFLKKHFKKIKK